MKTKIIAHRGASYEAPENTLSAVNLAWQQNTDAVEIDVQLTKDDRIVVFHDENLKRMTGVTGRISDKTWVELQNLKVSGRGKPDRIPLLDEVLPTIPLDKFLVVELKSGPAIVPVLKKLLEKFPVSPESLQFISLDEEVMLRVQETFPVYATQLVFEFDQEIPDPLKLIDYAQSTLFDGIDLEAGSYIDKTFIKKIHCLDKMVYVWTVNDPQEARRLVNCGIDGITTDRPGWLRDQIWSKKL